PRAPPALFRPPPPGATPQGERLLEGLEAHLGLPPRDLDHPDLVVGAGYLRVGGPELLPRRGQRGLQLLERCLVVSLVRDRAGVEIPGANVTFPVAVLIEAAEILLRLEPRA